MMIGFAGHLEHPAQAQAQTRGIEAEETGCHISVSAGTACVTVPADEPANVPEMDVMKDPGCFGGVEEMIQAACEFYGIGHEIPLAIARLETGHFTSAAYTDCNNVGGMSINEIPITYSSVDEGVDAFVSNLAENYIAQGLTTVEEISGKYCPVNADSWADNVTALMAEY